MRAWWWTGPGQPAPVVGHEITVPARDVRVGRITSVELARDGYLVIAEIDDAALIGGPEVQEFSIGGEWPGAAAEGRP